MDLGQIKFGNSLFLPNPREANREVHALQLLLCNVGDPHADLMKIGAERV